MTNHPIQPKRSLERPAKGQRIHTRRVKQAAHKDSTLLEVPQKPRRVKAGK